MSGGPVFEVRFEHSSAVGKTADARLVKWKVKIGSRVTHGSVVALYDDDPVEDAQKNADKLKRFKANLVGTVRKLLVSEGDTVHKGCGLLIVQGCAHPVVMKNMCAECGADLLEVKQELKQSTASVAMVHSIPELVVSNEQAQILGRADEARLIKSRKLVLLVDLDQTLVHTTNDDIPNNLTDVHHFQLYGSRSKWYHVRIRPGTQQFLKNVSTLYELHICTFGARYYAHIIAKFLDTDGRYFSHRILSRDECVSANSKMPNLKALFPCGDQMVCIIDDREDVWNFLPNVVQVKPYHFFQHTGDINAPPGLTKTERDKDGKYVIGTQQIQSKEDSVSTSSDVPTDVKSKSPIVNVDHEAEKVASVEKKSSPQQVSLESCEKVEIVEAKSPSRNSKATEDNNVSASNEASSESLEKADAGEPQSTTDSEAAEKLVVTDIATKEAAKENQEVAKTDVVENVEPQVVANAPDTTMPDAVDVIDEDDYLLYLTDILKKIHTAFYNNYDQMQLVGARGIPNLRDIVPLTRRSVLRGVRIVFSGVIPTNVAVEKSRAYQVARSLGAEIQTRVIKPRGQDEREDQRKGRSEGTTHLVAARLGTAKVSEARRMPTIHIVTPEWLWCCASRWDHVDERIFPLTKWSEQSREKKVRKDCDGESAANDQNPVLTIDTLSCGHLVYPTYDAVTGKRINITGQQNGNKAVKRVPENEQNCSTSSNSTMALEKVEGSGDAGEGSSGETARSSTQSFVQSINPLMSFGSEDIASMDQEVEDFLDAPDNESTSDEDCEERTKLLVLHSKREGDHSSSSDESLDDACPKGWAKKRKRSIGESEERSTDANGRSQERFLRGEIPMDSDRSASSGEDDESADSIGSVDDEMADAVERQLLEL